MTDEDEGPTLSESEPISDIDPEEMERLMADIGGIDDDNFGKNKKLNSDPSSKRQQKSQKQNIDESEDWDDDDILKSDRSSKDTRKSNTDQKSLDSGSISKKLPVSPQKRDRKKVLSNLFDSNTESKDDIGQSENNKKNIKVEVVSKKKIKEISFDDDNDLLDEPVIKKNVTKKESKSDGGGFLDSLLGASSTSKSKKNTNDFILPEKYKSPSINNKSPPSDQVKDPTMDDFFSTDLGPRRRRGVSSNNKSFKVDDDDILGSTQTKKTSSKADSWLFDSSPKNDSKDTMQEEIDSNKNDNSLVTKKTSISKSPQKDDWLNTLLSNKTSPSNAGKSTVIPASKASPTQTIKGNVSQYSSTNSQDAIAQLVPAVQPDFSSLSSIMQAQQQQAESRMMQQFQVQIQEQQQKMMQMMAQQKSFSRATTESEILAAELELYKKQHLQENRILDEAHKKKFEMEKDVWTRTEKRMKEERQCLIEVHEMKITELLKEKSDLIATYDSNLVQMKSEWTDNLERTKELYGSVIERMKSEHQNAVQRLTDLKNLELQAVVSATGKAKEVECVFELLESNTANLSKLTSSIQERNESAFDITKRALQLKEKQLKEMEAQLHTSRAEAESERNRLAVLINRLESNLSNQGTEVETEKWKMSQERMKIEIEKRAFAEEKKMFQMRIENERRDLANIKETMWTEQREIVQTMVKQKTEIAAYQAQISDKFSNSSALEANVVQLGEEKRLLEERVVGLKLKREELMQEQLRIEEKKVVLRTDEEKVFVSKEVLQREKEHFELKQQELDDKELKLRGLRSDNHRKLSEITVATQNLYREEDSIKKLRSRLQMEEEEAMQFIHKGLCPQCKSSSIRSLPSSSISVRRPADGREQHRLPFVGWTNKRLEPASVLERLQAARQQEAAQRTQNQLTMARLNN